MAALPVGSGCWAKHLGNCVMGRSPTRRGCAKSTSLARPSEPALWQRRLRCAACSRSERQHPLTDLYRIYVGESHFVETLPGQPEGDALIGDKLSGPEP